MLVPALRAEHRGAMTPGRYGRWGWEGEHLLLGRGQAEHFLQVLHTQPQSPNLPMPSQSSFSTVTYWGGSSRLPLQSNVTAQSVFFLKSSPLCPANHLQPGFAPNTPKQFPSPIPCLRFLLSLVLSSTIWFQGRKIILLSFMRTQYKSVHNSLKYSFSMRSVFHPGLLTKFLVLSIFSSPPRQQVGKKNHSEKLLVFSQKTTPQNKMQYCDLLKTGWSLTLQDKYPGTGILHPHRGQLQLYTSIWESLELAEEEYNSTLEQCHPTSVFELMSGHQAGANLSPICLPWPLARKPPFLHQGISTGDRLTLLTGINKAVSLWTLQDTTAIFPVAPIRTSCDRFREEEALETGIPCLPRKLPPFHSASNRLFHWLRLLLRNGRF